MNALKIEESSFSGRFDRTDSRDLVRNTRRRISTAIPKVAGRRRFRPDFGGRVSPPPETHGLSETRAGMGNIETEPYIELRYADVVRRAVQLWKSAGGPARRILEFWLQAEVELLSEAVQPRPQGQPG